MEKIAIKKTTGILLLDVETCHNYPLIMEIAFYTVNNLGTITNKGHYIIRETWENESHKNGQYAKEKVKKWQQDIDNGIIKIVSAYHLGNILAYYIEKSKSNLVSAYNVNFDIRALNTTFKHYKVKNPLPKLKKFCLWNYAKSIYATKSYIQWAIDNQKFTPTGKISSNVETLHQYLSEKGAFKETHIAHEDLLIEYNILMCAMLQNTMKRNNNLELEQNGNWRIVEQVRAKLGL